MKPCIEPNCPRLAVLTSKNGSRCHPCERQRNQERNALPQRAVYHNPRYRALTPLGPCGMCGAWDDLTWDHIVPISRGGTNDWKNLQCLCRSCNSSKGATL